MAKAYSIAVIDDAYIREQRGEEEFFRAVNDALVAEALAVLEGTEMAAKLKANPDALHECRKCSALAWEPKDWQDGACPGCRTP